MASSGPHKDLSRRTRAPSLESSKTFSGVLRGFIMAVQDLLRSTCAFSPRPPRKRYTVSSGPFRTSSGALACLHQGRPRPPRERYAASSGPFKTSSGALHGFIRTVQDLLRSTRTPSSGSSKTSLGALHSFIRAVRDLLRSICAPFPSTLR